MPRETHPAVRDAAPVVASELVVRAVRVDAGTTMFIIRFVAAIKAVSVPVALPAQRDAVSVVLTRELVRATRVVGTVALVGHVPAVVIVVALPRGAHTAQVGAADLVVRARRRVGHH